MVADIFVSEPSELLQIFLAEGLEYLGTAHVPASGPDLEEAQTRYDQWLAEGRNGTMKYLDRHGPAKYHPDSVLEGTRSVIFAGLQYFQPRPEAAPASGLVARYAWGRDYHKVLLKKLQRITTVLSAQWPQERWRSFTDTAPLDERWWAAQAGASFTARNTLAINRRLGSWFLLGEILTTKAFPATGPRPHAHGTCPSACRRCTDVCPTGALGADGRMDATRCISYLTIEHQGPIDDELKSGIQSWLFGCDLCQEVCPFNLAVRPTQEPEFLAWKAGPDLDLGQILALGEAEFTARFAGSPVHRTGRSGLVRNACLVAANLGRIELRDRILDLCDDPNPGVADAARWAIQKLTQGSAS
jgi:epoxyqueuosine reductase